MSEDPRPRGTRRAQASGSARPDRRSWLSHGLLALAISALGLAVAGSISLTTNAETTGVPPGPRSGRQAGPTAGTPAAPGRASVPNRRSPASQAFLPTNAGSDTARTPQLRSAIVKERAAQRAETLAKTSEQVSTAVRDEASAARQKRLNATERAIQENAVKLAWARQQRALAARIAASIARASIETAQAAASTTTANTPRPVPPPILSSPSSGGAVSPVPGAVIGAGFGQVGLWARYHTGLDFRAAYGTPIRAVKAGTVLFAGNSGDWAGIHVAIQHADGMTTMYCHMSAMAVQAGQTVQAGQVIGYVGQTGRAFGAHLHFELYPAGVRYGDLYSAINPAPWLTANGVQTH